MRLFPLFVFHHDRLCLGRHLAHGDVTDGLQSTLPFVDVDQMALEHGRAVGLALVDVFAVARIRELAGTASKGGGSARENEHSLHVQTAMLVCVLVLLRGVDGVVLESALADGSAAFGYC